MSTEHTRKKNIKSSHLQPTITSFFNNSPNASPTIAQSSKPVGQLAPLPGSIHSSLLQLGMRVRKSVQDGYKTKSTYKLDLNGTDDKENDTPALPQGSMKNKRGMDDEEDAGFVSTEVEMNDSTSLEERKFAKASSRRGFHQAVLRKSDSDVASKTGLVIQEDFGEAPFLKFDEMDTAEA